MERIETEPIRLIILEKEELYKYLYLSLPLGEQINLIDVFSSFDINKIKQEIGEYYPDVLIIGSDKLDDKLVRILLQIREEYPTLGVTLLLFNYGPRDSDIVREIALKGNGGLAVFLRQSLLQVEQFIGIIKATKQGQYIFDPALASYMFTNKGHSPFLEQLTNREMETLSLLAKGYNNSAIAEALYIDIKTVEHHLNSLYGKLKADNDFDRKHPRVTAARLYLQEVETL